MSSNQLTFHIKRARTLAFNIVTGTTVNGNTDGSGTLNVLSLIGTTTPYTPAFKAQVREIRVSLNGNLTTATAVRFFKSTSPTAPTAANTVYLGNDILLPVTTFAATTSYTPSFLAFEDNQFMLDSGEYLYCTIAATITNGADAMAFIDTFDEA